MIIYLNKIFKQNLAEFKELVAAITQQDKKYLLRNDILLLFYQYCDQMQKSKAFRNISAVYQFFKKIQEIIVEQEQLTIVHRISPGKYRFLKLIKNADYMEELKLSDYLNIRDRRMVKKDLEPATLQIDYLPFYDFSPSIKDSKTIGNGIRFLNRYLCSKFFNNPEKWNTILFEFLKMHRHHSQDLLVNSNTIKDFDTFRTEVEKAIFWLKRKTEDTPYTSIALKLKRSGFEPGWGHTAGRVLENMQLLIDILNEPNHKDFERFISRVPIPLISKIAIISPHGWFAQENVIGKPDTGGQVIYILDQVKALERCIKSQFELSGLGIIPKIIVVTRLIPEAVNTTCDLRLERICQTGNGWILRVPFRDKKNDIHKSWLSRFQIWPYLHRFAQDVLTELTTEFDGSPDIVIGNYSDGNLVSTLLADKFNVTHCTIAHALEKTKYLFSDLFWRQHEKKYNFSTQFTADMLAMNKADFIITSTQQEIVGTEDSIGQYESYSFFTLPGLYQVKSGINLFAPKFNVIPPGVNQDIYFPYYLRDRRKKSETKRLKDLIFFDKSPDIHGILENPDKIPIFAMARLDRIKNITGLIEAFGLSNKLQSKCNLIFAAGTIHSNHSKDAEEKTEIEKVYRLINKYKIHHKIRWLPSIEKKETGEVYRIIADQGGFFVQPALFEAFGLTVLEAMVSGLPTFATKFGGPSEIIEYGKNGFLLNTSKPNLIASSLEAFLKNSEKDNGFWQEISNNGIKRVQEYYNWELYSNRFMNLAKLYGFWRYSVSAKGKLEMDRYSDLIYHFLIKKQVR
jgi:sucrose synthase